MAKFKKGILGPVSGKLGPVVGASWKGITYLRSAQKRKKSTKRSPAQLANQYKFKYLNKFLVAFHPYLNNGFRHVADSKTEINAGFTAKYKFVTRVHPDFSIDMSQLLLSKSDLATLKGASVSRVNNHQLQLTWDFHMEKDAYFDDQLMLVIYSPELEKTDGIVCGVKRSVRHYIFNLDQRFINKEPFIYVAMLALNGKAVSDSIFLGRMVKP